MTTALQQERAEAIAEWRLLKNDPTSGYHHKTAMKTVTIRTTARIAGLWNAYMEDCDSGDSRSEAFVNKLNSVLFNESRIQALIDAEVAKELAKRANTDSSVQPSQTSAGGSTYQTYHEAAV